MTAIIPRPALAQYRVSSQLVAQGLAPAGPKLPLKIFADIGSGWVEILYSVVARELGEYADTGLNITVLVDGRAATVDVISFRRLVTMPSDFVAMTLP